MCADLSKPQSSPMFAFSHPAVYAFRVEDRVDALDKFIQKELHPKLLRLREEHSFIEHQLHRTITRLQATAGTSPTARQKQAARFKHQAWSWKRTSKQQELNRFTRFFELATDLRRVSKELNPTILQLTMLRQRSQSNIKQIEDSADGAFDEKIERQAQNRRHKLEYQRLTQEYHNACKENIQLSKSIQEQTEKLSRKNMDDASIISSLMIFGYNYIACSTCQARFHKDYIDALVAPIPTECEKNATTYICFHCWDTKNCGQSSEEKCGQVVCSRRFTLNQMDITNENLVEEIPPSSTKSAKSRDSETTELQINRSLLDDCSSHAKNNTEMSERSGSWRSIDSSMGDNSILGSKQEDSVLSEITFDSTMPKYTMVDTSNVVQAPLEKNSSWSHCESSNSSLCGDSLFSECSTETPDSSHQSAASSEHARRPNSCHFKNSRIIF